MKTAQVLHEEGTRKGKVETLRTQLGAWSSRWRWVSRADAYDAHIDARNRSRLEARRDEILERVGHGGQLLSYTALRALAGDAKEGIAPLDPRSLGPSDIVRFVRAAAQLELQSLGQVTDLRGAFLIAPATVTRIVGAIADVALDFIPEERHEAFLRAAAVAATGSELA